MPIPRNLDEFFQTFADKITDGNKKGYIKKSFFTSTPNGDKTAHSLILCRLIEVAIEKGYNVETEKKINLVNCDKRKYFADIFLQNEKNYFAIIEYESTNSSDRRIYDYKRDKCLLKHYKHTESDIKNNLQYYVVIVSLPTKNSVDIKYNIRNSNKLGSKQLTAKKDPYDFFMHEYKLNLFNQTLTDPQFILCNLNDENFTVEYPTNFFKEYSLNLK